MADKYASYDRSIASILRGFDEYVQTKLSAIKFPGIDPEASAYINSRVALLSLADLAQREIDECRAAKE